MPALLLRYLPHLAIAAALLGALWWFSHNRYHAGYEAATAEMAEAVRKAESLTKAAEARAQSITEAKDREWQSERSNLESRINGLLARPAPAIRLCQSTGRRDVPAVPAATGQPDAAAGDDGSGMRVGDDISGPALVLAGKCERDRRQLSALQSWIAAQAQ